jgi:hypothetical protein
MGLPVCPEHFETFAVRRLQPSHEFSFEFR